jgi:hypothetical protein
MPKVWNNEQHLWTVRMTDGRKECEGMSKIFLGVSGSPYEYKVLIIRRQKKRSY